MCSKKLGYREADNKIWKVHGLFKSFPSVSFCTVLEIAAFHAATQQKVVFFPYFHANLNGRYTSCSTSFQGRTHPARVHHPALFPIPISHSKHLLCSHIGKRQPLRHDVMSDCWMTFGDIEIERNKWMVFRKEGGIGPARWFIFLQTWKFRFEEKRETLAEGWGMKQRWGFWEQREEGWKDDGWGVHDRVRNKGAWSEGWEDEVKRWRKKWHRLGDQGGERTRPKNQVLREAKHWFKGRGHERVAPGIACTLLK